ncbi:MAG TPA: thiamine pyrophosphate-binding protein [Gammaproteobacteria bacterium]|nr:thiamine pyrophosphate-binding protein [Gammaproteobacteria bacterium]
MSTHPPPQTGLDASDIILYYLEQIGCDYIFGIPGGAIEPLYDALARSSRRGGIRPVVARHENGAVFMADGYARQTGRLGVCCATTGPGTTNMITGLADAHQNNVPLLAISAQTPLPTFGRGAFQESSCTGIDTVNMLQHCTRYSTLVSHIDQLQHKLITAVMTAFHSPRGPVHLSIPLDVMRQKLPDGTPRFDLPKLLQTPHIVDPEKTTALLEDIARARRVAIVLGGGCGEAIGAILAFAERLDAYLITTPHGKGLVNPDHPRYRGVIGFAGHSSARAVLTAAEVDLIIAVETNLSEWASGGWSETALLNERLVHIDSVSENLTRSPMARLHVRGHVLAIFEEIMAQMEAAGANDKQAPKPLPPITAEDTPRFSLDEETKCLSDATPIKPQRLMHELNQRFPANTRFFADTGNSVAWAVHYLQPKERRSHNRRGVNGGLFRTSIEFSSMGWAIGAAVGAALAYPDGPVVSITGDGSFLMSGQELSVAVAEQLSVIFVILNDHALGMVKHGQRLAGAESIAHQLPETDFAALARAMGAEGIIIHSPQDMQALDIETLCSRQGPTVLDVRIDAEEVPPMSLRVQGLRRENERRRTVVG